MRKRFVLLATGSAVCTSIGRTPGGLLPNIGSTSTGNLAGMIGYCIKNKVLGEAGASSVLNGLFGRSDASSSKDFSLGQSGLLETGTGTRPLDNVKDTIRRKICDLVLKHAAMLL